MKFKYFGLNLEYPIRDCYSKFGFGFNEPHSLDFQYEVALFIEEEAQKRNLPFTVEINSNTSEFTIVFADNEGNTYTLENEPKTIKHFLDELDYTVF